MRSTVVRGNVATPSPDSATAVESAPHEPHAVVGQSSFT